MPELGFHRVPPDFQFGFGRIDRSVYASPCRVSGCRGIGPSLLCLLVNTSPSAVEMNFVGCYEGCRCRKNGCYDHCCPCFIRNVGCTSKCKCPATVCVNPIGVRGGEHTTFCAVSDVYKAVESGAEPGGQRGTSDTPDEAELVPQSQIVQPRDTSPSAVNMDFVNYFEGCSCMTDGCNDWRCICFASNVGCSSKCLCLDPVCVNPIGIRGGEHTTFCVVSDVYKAVESNAEPGGQRGTSDTPDEAGLVPQSLIVQPRDTAPLAVNMNFVNYFEGCWCKTDGCNDWRCFCFANNVGCGSKCLCPDPVCVNPIGVRGGEHTTFAVSDVYKAVESNAELGGQRGTSGTPGEAGLVPQSQIVQPRDTSPPAVIFDFLDYDLRCWCKTNGCNDWHCPCFVSNVGCSSKCLCPAPMCVNPIGVRGGEHTTFCAVSDVYKAVESNAEPGGQQGTGGTSNIPDEAEPDSEPKRQAVQPRCCCINTKCLDGYCVCFNGNWLCSEDCVCEGCRNIESNEKEVLMLYKEFVKRKLDIDYKFPFEPIPKRKLGAVPLAKGNRCRCTRKTGCTLNCKCKDCRNPFGAREAGVSNAGPGQTTPPSSTGTKPNRCHCKHKVRCTSYCKCLGCDNPKGAKGSESNTGSGSADGVGNIPDEAVQTTTPSITEPGQVDTSSMPYCPDQPLRPISEWPGGFHGLFGVPPLPELTEFQLKTAEQTKSRTPDQEHGILPGSALTAYERVTRIPVVTVGSRHTRA
ncbi:hypothetical protein ZWY2020_045593 [Hordeum vulgare]|nr:hypothetical protein ZWY2020_045593 [Hordeum vulgare]